MAKRTSGHMKRISAPKRYDIQRKASTYLANTRAGPHRKDDSLPLIVVIRDTLKIVATESEGKKILNEKKVLVDQKVRTDKRFPVGLMDVVTIPELNHNYRTVLGRDNIIRLLPIAAEESKVKLCKILNKTKNKKGETQLNLHDGRNMTVEKDSFKTGDSLLISLPDQHIQKHISFEKGAQVYIINGTHTGEMAEIIEVKPMTGSTKDRILLKAHDGENFETLKTYVFVTGKEKAEIKLSGEH